jgi:hypothetical protein
MNYPVIVSQFECVLKGRGFSRAISTTKKQLRL